MREDGWQGGGRCHVHFYVLECREADDEKNVVKRRERRYFTPADASVSASFLSLPLEISFWELAWMPAISCADFPESVTDSLHLDPASHMPATRWHGRMQCSSLCYHGKNIWHRAWSWAHAAICRIASIRQTEQDGGDGYFQGRRRMLADTLSSTHGCCEQISSQ